MRGIRPLIGLAALSGVVLVPAQALARAGGGSGGYGGGGGGRGGEGLFFILYFLFRNPILLAVVVIAIAVAAFMAWVQSVRYRQRRRDRVRQVELAAAEAADDDEAFEVERVREQSARLFTGVQEAWDDRDRRRLAGLVGADLLVEWTRRLDDFERRGWHNRVSVAAGPSIEYVSLVNRAEDRDDRVVVRVEAILRDVVEDRGGRVITRSDSPSETRRVAEYWTLGKADDGGWMLLSIEQGAEGDHHLTADLVTTPWGDDARLRDAALVEGAVADALPAGTAVAEIATIGFAGDARAEALDLSLADARLAPDVLEVAVRRAVAAWAEAVDGSDRDLIKLASPDAVRELLHPGDPMETTRLVVRGPRVLAVRIERLDAHAEPPRMTVGIEVRGRRYVENRDTAVVVSGSQTVAARFTERWTFALDGSDANPWRIVDAAPAPAPITASAAP